MKFKQLHLHTNQLASEKQFYAETLGFAIIEESATHLSFQVGWTILTFQQSELAHKYHYCFLIPCNQLQEALEWMEKRWQVVEIEEGAKTVHFDDWNADSFYFYDGSGNIAECIVRYDLQNESEETFDASSFLCVNEMGLGSNNIVKINMQLEEELSTKFWKGDYVRFGTNGSQEGLFLLPNYEKKEIWFPTEISIEPEPFEAWIENEGQNYAVIYENGTLITSCLVK